VYLCFELQKKSHIGPLDPAERSLLKPAITLFKGAIVAWEGKVDTEKKNVVCRDRTRPPIRWGPAKRGNAKTPTALQTTATAVELGGRR
jgi:hypothetical protein